MPGASLPLCTSPAGLVAPSLDRWFWLSGCATASGLPACFRLPYRWRCSWSISDAVMSDPVLRQTPRPAGTWGALGPSGGDWTVRGRGTGAPPLSTCLLCSLLRPTGKLSFLSPTLPQCRLLREVLLRPAGRARGPRSPGHGLPSRGFQHVVLDPLTSAFLENRVPSGRDHGPGLLCPRGLAQSRAEHLGECGGKCG